jgi:hypothetical protein
MPIMDFVPPGFRMSNHNVVGKSHRTVIDSLLAADTKNSGLDETIRAHQREQFVGV